MAGFDQHDDGDAITGINVTPLVDITLVLLIVFMVTTSYIVNPSIKVDLPKAQSGEKTDRSLLSIVLDRQGVLHLNGRRIDESGLRAAVKAEVDKDPRVQAVISADTMLLYGKVVGLIDLIKRQGVRRYALNIRFSDEPGPP